MARIANPKMIILGRESRGITQGELTKRLRSNQGRMSKVEHGLLEAPLKWMPKLSSILNYPEEFFYESSDIYPPGVHFYRKQISFPQKALNQLVAIMNIRRFHLEKLLLSADLDITSLPQCDLDECGSPEEAARAVRQYFRLPYGPIENMTNVLEDAGVIVMPYRVGTHAFSGVSFPMEQGCYCALLNSEMPSDRSRFTLAHELGHLVMHRLPSQNNMEEEANRFAGEFLMPTREILPQLHRLSLQQLAILKRYWKVAMGAILQHALRLEQVTERHYKSLRIELTTRGYHRREPIELDPPTEQPTLITELLQLHREKLGFGIEEVSQLLRLFRDEFVEIYAPYMPGFSPLHMVPSSQ